MNELAEHVGIDREELSLRPSRVRSQGNWEDPAKGAEKERPEREGKTGICVPEAVEEPASRGRGDHFASSAQA